jgi:hypothetical protein
VCELTAPQFYPSESSIYLKAEIPKTCLQEGLEVLLDKEKFVFGISAFRVIQMVSI